MTAYVKVRGKCAVCGRQRKMQLVTVQQWVVCTECLEWMNVRKYTHSEQRSFIRKALELYPQ